MKTISLSLLVSVFTLTFNLPVLADALVAHPPQELVGTVGRFDFIKIDPIERRLLACHTENGTLDIIDLATGKLIRSVRTGNAQGVAMDAKGHRYFVSVSKPPSLVIVDSETFNVIGQIPLPDPADLVAYREETNRVFVCNDEKPELWIIDPETKTTVGTIKLPGAGMEDLGFDDHETFLYQCLKETGELAKIDPAAESVVEHWPTSPAEKPHGLALVPGTDSALVVGGNGKLALMNLTTGKVVSSVDVSPRVDEIAYDPKAGCVYCASGLGTISVAEVNGQTLSALPAMPSQPGDHSIAVDPATGTVWIAFAQPDHRAFVQSFERK